MPDTPDNSQPPQPPASPDAQFITGVCTSVPISDMMGSWCSATVEANGQAAQKTADFIREVCFDKDGNVQMVPTTMKVGNLTYTESVPLISFVKIPSMEIKESVFGVDMEITTSNVSKSSVTGSVGGSTDVQVGWGPVSAKIHVEGKFCASKENTHSQDASAKVHAQITMAQAEVPIGVKRYLDRLQTVTDAYTNQLIKQATGQADDGEKKAA